METNRTVFSLDGGRDEVIFCDNVMVDDDGGHRYRNGELFTASAYIITAVIGSGVLSLAWATAQLGWLGGGFILLLFSIVTYFNSTLLADCYPFTNPVTGRQSITYIDVVRTYFGGWKVKFCTVLVYVHMIGVCVGHTIVASVSMLTLKKSHCSQTHGQKPECGNYTKISLMIVFGCVQIILSQIPNFVKLCWLVIAGAFMGVVSSVIGISLCIIKVTGANNGHPRTHIFGARLGLDVTMREKIWRTLQAIGYLSFAYSYSVVLVEIQNLVHAPPPERKTIKRASLLGVSVITTFYFLCGSLGYAAFGNDAPRNFLIAPTTFYDYDPYWLVQIASVSVLVHLMGTYQLFSQPIFTMVENWSQRRLSQSTFITYDYQLKLPKFLGGGVYPINCFRLIWRSLYVVIITFLAIIFPFFDDFLGLIGPVTFWPLTVYFPVQMHISQAKIRKYSVRWFAFQLLNYACLVVFLMGAVGFIPDLLASLKTYKPF